MKIITAFLILSLMALPLMSTPQSMAKVKPEKPGKPPKPDDPPPDPDPEPGTGDGVIRKYAVVVGISDYATISDLSYCDEDAEAWASWFNAEGYSVTKYIDRQATEANVRNALSNALSSADGDDIVAFASSGHGTYADKHSVLIMQDYGAAQSYDGLIWDVELQQIFDGAVCKFWIFLDHCNSGGMNEVMQNANSANGYLTTTCTYAGYGYDVPQYEHGAWTYWFLVQALQNQNSPTLEDAFDYASANYPYVRKDAPQEFDGAANAFAF